MKNALESMNMPKYNDDQGDVFLMDDHGKIIDFFHYDEQYHSPFLNENEGVSLERIYFDGPSNDPGNWQSAASTAAYATPGETNSQFLLSRDENEEITVEPKVFDPGNNGFRDFTMIKCRFPTAGNMASIRILDPIGRHIKSIISHKSIGAEEDFKWEGLNDNGQVVRMGPYIVYVEVYNATGFTKVYKKR